MTSSWILRPVLSIGVVIAALATAPAGFAQPASPALLDPVLPPLSAPKMKFYQSHPAEWTQLLANLPRRPAETPRGATHQSSSVTSRLTGGTWQDVTTAPFQGLCNPLLLSDGTVIVASCDTPDWYKLTPDINGNYADGTWSQIASLPVIGTKHYAPQYHSSAVLPDGRVIIMGGEYNGSNSGVWTNEGAVYNPVTNVWTAVNPPAGSSWTMIGDAESTMLPNGLYLQAACCAYPAADALLDPASMTWSNTGAPTAGGNYQDEQGYNLLPNGNVLTLDIWTNYPAGGATNAEQYNPATGVWTGAGNTPVSLVDPAQCGNWEIGPAVLRGDGTLVAFGGNTGCVAPTADPIAIYDTTSGTWTAGPNLPAICGRTANLSCTLPDAPGALLPNGNILFAASDKYGDHPTHFFEFTRGNFIKQVPDTLNYAGSSGAYYYNFLVLPNGQILSTDFSSIAEVFTETGRPESRWAPTITSAPAEIGSCQIYNLQGKQFSGVTQGAYYGDDVQGFTNFPIVRIVNQGTGHVFYARTFNFGAMTVKPGATSAVDVLIPGAIETGASTLSVIANGIASSPVNVTVETSGGC
ncbi:MAG: kelch repeat-containing protein [Rhizomicrobium sp.]|jgi:hypothetical protein